MTSAWSIVMRRPRTTLMTCLMELCDDNSMEHCDGKTVEHCDEKSMDNCDDERHGAV